MWINKNPKQIICRGQRQINASLEAEHNWFMFILVIISRMMISSWRLYSLSSLQTLHNLIPPDPPSFPPENKHDPIRYINTYLQLIQTQNIISGWNRKHIMSQSYIQCFFHSPLLPFFPPVLMTHWWNTILYKYKLVLLFSCTAWWETGERKCDGS